MEVSLLAVLLATVALSAPKLTWDTVSTQAIEVWNEGPGASEQVQAAGARQAARRVPVGPTSVRGEAQLGLAEQQQWLVAVEVPLGLGIAERRYWSALADARTAGADAARWAWVQEVQVAWLDWWTASEIAEHLETYARDVEDELSGFERAVDEGLLAPLTLEDLRAEAVQVRAEAAAMEQRAEVTGAHVRALLGERDLDAGNHELHEADMGAVNPWVGLSERADQLPAVRQSAARATAEQRRARALGAERIPRLEAGPMWAPADGGAMAPFAYVGVSVPLQPGVGPDQRDARASADAARAEQRWRERSLAAHLREEELGWEATRQRLLRLQTEVLGPLVQRQERLEQALSEGLVTADRVVRARRERHEAEHEQVLIAGELLASEARADAVRHLLEGDA